MTINLKYVDILLWRYIYIMMCLHRSQMGHWVIVQVWYWFISLWRVVNTVIHSCVLLQALPFKGKNAISHYST
jgi:hypothetical protein